MKYEQYRCQKRQQHAGKDMLMGKIMCKEELIACICEINRSAKPEFLAQFTEEELQTYLERLMELDLEELVIPVADL